MCTWSASTIYTVTLYLPELVSVRAPRRPVERRRSHAPYSCATDVGEIGSAAAAPALDMAFPNGRMEANTNCSSVRLQTEWHSAHRGALLVVLASCRNASAWTVGALPREECSQVASTPPDPTPCHLTVRDRQARGVELRAARVGVLQQLHRDRARLQDRGGARLDETLYPLCARSAVKVLHGLCLCRPLRWSGECMPRSVRCRRHQHRQGGGAHPGEILKKVQHF